MKYFLILLALCLPAPAFAQSIGVNGHDGGSPVYENTEETFRLLDSYNIRLYRFDIGHSPESIQKLAAGLALAKKYNITLRPMLYVDTNPEQGAYEMAKAFAADIKIWELGNELNLKGVAAFDENIDKMIAARKGVMRAAAETGMKLETSLGVATSLDGPGLNKEKTSYPFIDRAIQKGLEFDYITFHYYVNSYDRKDGWIKTWLEPLRQYNKKVFLNETNCAQIYNGDDGNSQECADALESLLAEIKLNYADMVTEINIYELYDEPIEGPEGHFGLMFDPTRPKRTMDVVRKYTNP